MSDTSDDFREHCPDQCRYMASLGHNEWVGVGGFSKVVATFSHVIGSFNLFMATTRDDWIIPSFWIWVYVLHVGHISCVITNCGQHQWVTVSHPFSSLNSSLGFAGGKRYHKITISVFRLDLLLFQVAFLKFYSIAIFSPYFSSGWFVIAVCGSVSVRELVTAKPPI